MHLETLAVHAGIAPDPTTGAVTPSIVLATSFARGEDHALPGGYLYARDRTPNREALETAIAALEGGAVAAAFASGQAATTAIAHALRPGDHVLLPSHAYYGTARVLRDMLVPWGLETSVVDMRDVDSVARAMRARTRLVWIETPSNPLLTLTDIERIADVAHAGGARCACDNTWATPVLQRPLALGADLVMHSTTKYLAGHGDVMGGAVVARADDEFFQRVRAIQTTGGAVASPFDAWLVRRGLRTLPWRMRAHVDNAVAVAQALDGHPAVAAVHYPGLAAHPDHALAARQMRAPGGMLSIQVRGGREAALAVVARVRLFTRATSLGGPESLVEHRASVEGPGSTTPDDLLRLSIGLEHPDDLVDDLRHALAATP